jgi:hypothetical protein
MSKELGNSELDQIEYCETTDDLKKSAVTFRILKGTSDKC